MYNKMKRMLAMLLACIMVVSVMPQGSLVRAKEQVTDTSVAGEENTSGSEENVPEGEENASGSEENVPGGEENTSGSEENVPGSGENASGDEENVPGSEENAPGTEEISMELSESSLSLKALGEAVSLTASVVGLEEGAAASIVWWSSDTSVATVQAGLVTPLKQGNATITATLETNADVTAACEVQVDYADITGIEIVSPAEDTIELEKGSSLELNAVIKPAQADPDTAVEWKAEKIKGTAIATVKDGVLTAESVVKEEDGTIVDTTTVTATAGEFTDSFTVRVVVPDSGITLEPTTFTLRADGSSSENKMELKATILPGEATNQSITWASSDEEIAMVKVDGVVLARNPGEAIITATSASGRKAEATVIVKSAASSVTIENKSVEEDETVYAAESATLSFAANVGFDLEYCVDTVTWSIDDGTSDGEAKVATITDEGVVTLNPLPEDIESAEVTVSVKVGEVSDSFTFNVARKADTEIILEDFEETLVYGTSGAVIAVTRKAPEGSNADLLKEAVLTFEVTDGTDVAEVKESTGEVILLKQGTFTVKAYMQANGYFEAVESEEKTYTVVPKELTIKIANAETAISKVSDGDLSLTEENKEQIKGLLELDGVLETDKDKISLDITEESLDALAYFSGNIFEEKNEIVLEGLQVSLVSNEDGNYTLSDDCCVGLKIGAKITAMQDEANKDINMSAQSEDFVLSAGGKKIAVFAHGALGSNGEYWYDEKGVKVTLQSGIQLVNVDGESVVTDGYLTGDSKTLFYVWDFAEVDEDANNIGEEDDVFYGAYTINFQKDGTKPVIELDAVEKLQFGREDMVYSIEVTDQDGSGIWVNLDAGANKQAIKYCVISDTEGIENAQWKAADARIESDGRTYTFKVSVPANGNLYVKAEDRVGNEQTSEKICSLVLEADEPQVSICIDDIPSAKYTMPYTSTHTVNIVAEDAGTEASGTKNLQSGIQQITYKLQVWDGANQTAEGDAVISATTSYEPAEKLEDLTGENAGTLLKKQVTYTGSEQNKVTLDGSYLLTITAVDWCGNEETVTQVLNYDNTPVSVNATMENGKQAADELYYYKADNCGVTVEFTDARLLDEKKDGTTGTYQVQVFGLDAEGKEVEALSKELDLTDVNSIRMDGDLYVGTISIDSAEMAGALKGMDGEVSLVVTAVDAAGNSASAEEFTVEGLSKEAETSNASEETTLEAYFMLDQTAPVIKGVDTPEAGKKFDGDYFYYNDAAVVLKFEFEEESFSDEGWKVSYSKMKNGIVEEKVIEQKDFVVEDDGKQYLSVTLQNNKNEEDGSFDDATYSNFVITGEDKAGNLLQLKTDGAEQVTTEEATDGENELILKEEGKIALKYGKVLDRTAPTAVIQFSKPHSLYDVTSYYGVKEGYSFTAELQYQDNYSLDTELLTYAVYQTEELNGEDTPLLGAEAGVEPVSTYSPKCIDGEMADLTKAYGKITMADENGVTEEGYYAIGITGTDRAGNYIAVTEMVDGNGTVQDKINTSEDNTMFLSGSKVIDRTAPTAKLVFNALDSRHIFGITSYYNEEIIAGLTFKDNNSLDAGRLFWSRSDAANAPVQKESEKAVVQFAKANSNPTQEDVDSEKETLITIPQEDGIYAVRISGEDKAGNKLIVSEWIGNPETEGSQNVAETDTAVCADGYFISGNKIYDSEAPTAQITFSELSADNIYPKEEANAEEDAAQSLTSYYNAAYGAAIAYSDNNIMADNYVAYQISDAMPMPVADGTKITAAYTGNEAVQPSVNSEDATCMESVILMPQMEGVYAVRISGEDKAGNKLVVSEKIGNKEVESNKNVDTADTEVCADGYFVSTNKVYDITAPAYTMTMTGFDESLVMLPVLGDTAYYNKDITAKFEIAETNFDSSRVGTAVTSQTADGNYGSYSPEWVTVTGGAGLAGEKQYSQTVNLDGVYRFEIAGEDKAGNKLVPSQAEAEKAGYLRSERKEDGAYWSLNKVRDTRNPTAILTVGDYYRIMVQSGALEKAEPYRRETDAQIKIAAVDNSPARITYTVNSTIEPMRTDMVNSTIEPKESSNEIEFAYLQTAQSKVNGQQIFYVSDITVTDIAGNEIKLDKTNKIYLDVQAPDYDELAPTISVVATSSGSQQTVGGTPLFSSDVPLSILINDPYAATSSSGLGKVTYQLYVNGRPSGEQVLKPDTAVSFTDKYEDKELTTSLNRTVTVAASSHNYNDLRLVVYAADNAGNTTSGEYHFGIDITAPAIDIYYDNNEAQNEKYFKENRTATIVVKERNFDPGRILIHSEIQHSGWTYSAGSAENGDDATWTTQIPYHADGIYTLSVEGTDILGHPAGAVTYSGTAPQDFVVDKTLPVIHVAYDAEGVGEGRKYFAKGCTATLQVTDENFQGSSNIAVTPRAGGVNVPVVFQGSTSVLDFAKDGIYSFAGTVTDLAGNVSETLRVSEFVIDQEKPTVSIVLNPGDEEDKEHTRRAFPDVIAPLITFSDDNYASHEITLTRAVRANAKEDAKALIPEVSVERNAYGEDSASVQFEDLAHSADNDGIYTLTVTVTDEAGYTETVTATYSVNRYGSVYVYSEDLIKLNSNYVNSTYVMEKSGDLYITAYNANKLKPGEAKLEIFCDGTLVENQKSKAVVAEEVELDEETGWYEYRFAIDKADLSKDGRYEVILSDKDEADNVKTNSDDPIWFYVDSKAPILDSVIGLERNSVNGKSQKVNYTISDTIGLKVIEIYVDDLLKQTITEEELLGMTSYSGEFTLDSGLRQKVSIVVRDRAGNVFTTDDESFAPAFAFNRVITVSDNFFVRWYANTAAFWGSIVGVLALVAALILFLASRRRKQEDMEE